MAKVRLPMAPDLEPTSSEKTYSLNGEILPRDHAKSILMEAKARFPFLTDKDLDEMVI
jgi:hypothetical protein